MAGIRRESRIRPRAGRLWRPLAASLVVVGLVAAGTGIGVALRTSASQTQSIRQLRDQVDSLQARVDAQPDWTVTARRVEPSVFTIETAYGLGSGWVARSGPSGSELVTNFHVVGDAWSAGIVVVQVKQGDRILAGTITRVDPNDDLAVIRVVERLPALDVAHVRPAIGQTVMAVGSPLGLGGSVSVGVISGFRSLEGSDYIQFSAPISPGNSGGAVVDARGRVVAVASAKFEGAGIEALSLAIPVRTACSLVVICQVGSDL